MLKTFIASLRSDKAVKELGKLGIAVKEVVNNVEQFRDSRKIIMDVALAAKYTDKDVQKPLLAISGGKFQWSKVSAMLSDYREIINNWEHAITAQGFTNEQIIGQMDTIARKWQTLKTELTSVIMSSANSGLTVALKNILDGLNKLMYGLQHMSSDVYNGAMKVSEFVACLYAAHKAMGIVSSGLVALGVEAQTVSTKINTAFAKNVIGITLFAAAEAIGYYLEKQRELEDQSERLASKELEEYANQGQLADSYQKRSDYVDTLCSAYVKLNDMLNSNSLSEEKNQKIKEDMSFIEEKLAVQIGDNAIKRIQASEDVNAAVSEEKQKYIDANNAKLKAIKSWLVAREKEAMAEYTIAQKEIEAYNISAQNFLNNIDSEIDGISALMSAEVAKYKLFVMLDNALLKQRKGNLALLERQQAEVTERLNNEELSDSERKALTNKNINLGKQIHEVRVDVAEREKELNVDANSLYYAAYGKEVEEAKAKLQRAGQILVDGMAGKSFDPNGSLGGDEVFDTGADDKSKKSREPRVQKQKEKDPVVISISNRMKNIESKLNDQLKSLNRIEKNQGTTLESAKKRNDLYKKAIADMQVEQGKTESHINEVNSQLFDTNVIKVSGAETSVEEINAAVEGFLGQTLENGTVACVEAVTKIGNAMQNQFLSQEFADGVVYVPRLVSDAGDKVIPFDASKLKAGDIIVYGDNDHVVMYDGKGGYVGNSSSANGGAGGVVHGNDYRQMGGQVPTKIIQSGAREVAVAFNDKLADFLSSTINSETHRVTQDEWDNAGISGQLELISNAMEDESNKSDDRQKFLQAVKEKLLESVKLLKETKDKIADLREKAADEWFSSADKAVSQAQKNAERKSNKELFELGNGATESDKARAEVAKTTAALAEYSKFMEDETTKEHENTEAFRDWQDKYLTASKAAVDAQVKLIEAQYNDAMKIIDHNAKMRDYGVDNTEDAWGQKRATDAYADLLTKRKALSKELEELDRTDPKYIEKHNAIQEELVSVNKEIRDASTKHIRTIREGYNKLVQELIFDGKDFGEMLRNLWVDLGRNAWDLLLTGKTDNPSFFAQLLGFGDLNKEAAEKQSANQWSQIQQYTGSIDTKINTTNNYLAQILSVLGTGRTFGYGSYDMSKSFSENLGLTKTYDTNIPFSQALGLTQKYDTNIPITKAFDTSTKAMLSMKKSSDLNTQKIVDNTNTMSNNTNILSSVGGTLGSLAGNLVGGLTGDSKLGGVIGSGISFLGSLFGLANGGSIPKFADGGAPSGRVKGAGTGRSDSILAYLRNKDKFVWLSNGEYVINEKSAKALGYDTLDKLNGYASGGPLDTSITNPTPYVPTINPQIAQRTTNIYGSNKMTEYLLREQNKKMAQQNEMLKNMGSDGGNGRMIVLNTQASSADVLRALQENPRAVQAIMGQQRNMGFR